MPTRKSPLHVVCTPHPMAAYDLKKGRKPPKPLCSWVCRGPLRAAEFVSRSRPGRPAGFWRAILHPSTKQPGRWQVSLFDSEGAWGDSVRDSCTEALDARDIHSSAWKLVAVE